MCNLLILSVVSPIRANETWKTPTETCTDFSSSRKILSIFQDLLQLLNDELLKVRLVSEETCPRSLRHIRLGYSEEYRTLLESKMSRIPIPDGLQGRNVEHAHGFAALVHFWQRELIELLTASGEQLTNYVIYASSMNAKLSPAMNLPT